MKASKIIITGLAAITSLGLASCDKKLALEESPKDIRKSESSMKVNMTDAPAAFEALDIEIDAVEVYKEDEGWIMLNGESQNVSVLELTNGIETTIAASNSLEAGLYTMLRITFGDENTLTSNASIDLSLLGQSASVTSELVFQSPADKQITIEIDQQLEAGADAELLVDFNVAQSVVESGQQYFLDPTVTLIEDASTGIQGSIEGAANAAILVVAGTDTISTFTNAGGEFMLRGMAEGTYEVLIEYTQQLAAGLDQLTQGTTALEGVAVTEGRITQMGSISIE